MLASTPGRLADHAPVLVLRRDAQAHACRTLPRHAGGSAAARRGQRRAAAVARSGRVDGIAAGGFVRRARAPPSGRSRARSIERWASPRADRRSCAQRSARACAGDVAAWIGWAPRCWDMFCACTEWRDTPVWSPSIEVCSRDVFMSLRDLICELYIMCNTICEEISRTAIISWTRSHLSGTNFADMGPQATRPQTSMLDSLETLDACCERMPSSAGGCGHQVCTWPDEKRGSARLKSLDRSPSARKK